MPLLNPYKTLNLSKLKFRKAFWKPFGRLSQLCLETFHGCPLLRAENRATFKTFLYCQFLSAVASMRIIVLKIDYKRCATEIAESDLFTKFISTNFHEI
jgi:hypothetical protein